MSLPQLHLPEYRSPALRLTPLCLLLALAYGAGPCSAMAQDVSDKLLDVVTVNGSKARGFAPNTVEAGNFRGSDIMEVPSTVNVITREVLDLQAAAGLYDAVRNTAGVTRQQNGGDTWDQLVIRGIAVDNRTGYRLNGSLPIMNFSQVPMEDKERVEVLKGASALYYGFTAPGGVVNFVTKRAGAEPVTTVGMTVDQFGTAIATADVARRFGEDQQVGVRVNAAGGTVGSFLDHVGDGNRAFGSAAVDWRVNRQLLLRADLEVDHRRTTEEIGVTLPTAVNGVITLPHTVDPRQLVGPDSTLFDTRTTNAALRADYAFSDNWSLTLEGGRSDTQRDRNLATFKLAAKGAVTGAGSISGNSQHLGVGSDLGRAELFGLVATGPLKHELTLGISQTDKTQDPVYQQNFAVASQNLYNPLPITTITYGAVPTSPTTAALKTTDLGVYALDRIELSPRWQTIVGLRHVNYTSDQGDDHYDAVKTAPMASLIFKITHDLSLYASAAQGLEEGETAPTGSANENQHLAPGVSHQEEFGTRWRAPNGTLISAAIYNITRPGYYTDASNIFVSNGEERYRGLELSTQGQLTERLSWQTSAQWLDPTFRDINATYNGKLPENAAKQTASAFLSYDLGAVPGLTFDAGAYYTGRRPVNDLDQAFLGGNTQFSVGSRYINRVMGKRVTWQANVDNAGDKQYWAGAGTRLAAGLPRVIKLTVKVDL
jgi:iron complex outermembrane receptor protein